MFIVYILRSIKNNSYYVGSTNNIERRLVEHNRGKSRYTKAALPWVLVYEEPYDTLAEARRREKEIKNWKKRDKIEKLIIMAP